MDVTLTLYKMKIPKFVVTRIENMRCKQLSLRKSHAKFPYNAPAFGETFSLVNLMDLKI